MCPDLPMYLFDFAGFFGFTQLGIFLTEPKKGLHWKVQVEALGGV